MFISMLLFNNQYRGVLFLFLFLIIHDISTLNGSSLKLVDKSTYLGSSVSPTETDINTLLARTWTAIDRLSVIWKSDLTDKIKPFTKTIQVRRTRHTGNCWRSRDEFISDIHLWNSLHGRAKAGRPARNYIRQLCEDTKCSIEDLPGAMDDREGWLETVRDIRTDGTTWWWRW